MPVRKLGLSSVASWKLRSAKMSGFFAPVRPTFSRAAYRIAFAMPERRFAWSSPRTLPRAFRQNGAYSFQSPLAFGSAINRARRDEGWLRILVKDVAHLHRS